jgi:hypothetical protein
MRCGQSPYWPHFFSRFRFGRLFAHQAPILSRKDATPPVWTPGDTVRLPAETFELSGTIHLKSSVKLIGARQEKTIEVLPAK